MVEIGGIVSRPGYRLVTSEVLAVLHQTSRSHPSPFGQGCELLGYADACYFPLRGLGKTSLFARAIDPSRLFRSARRIRPAPDCLCPTRTPLKTLRKRLSESAKSLSATAWSMSALLYRLVNGEQGPQKGWRPPVIFACWPLVTAASLSIKQRRTLARISARDMK